MLAVTADALPAAPSTLVRTPSESSNQVTLSWSEVPGATAYQVKRGTSPVSSLSALATVTSPHFIDTTATPGSAYFYAVATTDPSGESPPTRGIMAGTGTIVDNGGPGTSFTGTWLASNVPGYYGSAPVYASFVSGSTPTASYTITPTLAARGNYDVYLRWTANPNRATNTPVDLAFPDGGRTANVNQQVNNGVWMLLTSITAEAGATASVTLRNNGANGYIIADAIQFIPRHSPWAPAADGLQNYTLAPINEHFDGMGLDASVWSTFLGRSEYTVADGRLHTKLRYKGSVPLGSATTADLETESNWIEGGIIARQAQKFGFHEARVRLPQLPARGVDIAYWHAATDELINGYEIDAPEFFHKDSTGVANNYGFGVWDHVLPCRTRPGLPAGRTWDHTRNHSTLGDVSQYLTIGIEWRTDNSQVAYINGEKVFTAPASGMNDVESVLPSNIILSTKVLDWLHPNAALDDTAATWDYARYYQKPGFVGSVDGDWSNSANWGSDGKPLPGFAAVFNLSTAPAGISLPSDQELQSLYLDSANLPPHVFSGPGTLRLGAAKPGDDSVTHGGILVNTSVSSSQTFATPILALQNLQIANLSRTPNTTLFLNGKISGDGIAPRDVDFVSPIAADPALGLIALGQPLGSGIRHVNRAGDSLFILPAGSQHTGELRIPRGPVTIPAISSLGLTADSAIEFQPRYLHAENWRPRLTYTGPAALSNHPIRLGGWQADGVLESSGTGPLIWAGKLIISPSSGNAKQVLSRTPKLTISGNATSGENIFSGAISDAGLVISYKNDDNSTNSGPAVFSLQKAGTSTWSLTGDNSYCGTTAISGGTLAVSSLNSVNGGIPLLSSSSLGTPKTVVTGTVAITSGTLRYTGSGETTDRVISLAGSQGATIDHSGTGLLKFTSGFISSASTKTLILTGTGDGEIAGGIPNNSAAFKTNLIKSGTGAWTLSGANSYTGTSTISAGTLVVSGTLAGGGSLNVTTSTGRLSGTGVIATPSTINGSLVASPLTFSSTLTLGGSGKILANFTANNASGIGSINGATVTINNGAKVDVTLNSPGSTANFLQSYWRSARSIALLSATTKVGTLAVGTVTPDSAGNNAATYGVFTLQQTATIVNLVWTPIPGFPEIDQPSVALASPTANPVSVSDTATALRLTATIGGGATVAWSKFSGPGTVTFGDTSAADTTALFSASGTYLIRATATNGLGSAQADLTVHVSPPLTLTFRQGENDYSHKATFIRGDNPAWNSGSRDQLLVGRSSSGVRGLLEFDLGQVPAGAGVTNASLDLWIAATGSGTNLETLRLHELIATFTEGSGDGISATYGTGTGADWTNRMVGMPWLIPGAAAESEYATPTLAGISSFDPSTTIAGTRFTLSGAALATAAATAINTSQALDLMLKMDADDTGANRFVRLASDDHATPARRPLLTLTLNHQFVPTVDPGSAPIVKIGTAASLNGMVTQASAANWTKLSGPGAVIFNDSSSAATTALFSAAGNHVLALSASNVNGETSRLLAISVISNLQLWEQANFTNPAYAAPGADPDFDGLANLLEFAIGTSPNDPTGSVTHLTASGDTFLFTYRRSHAAVADGVQFHVEWSDTLGGDWIRGSVIQALVTGTNDGTSNQWTATLPASSGPQRFARLFVSSP